MPAFQKIVHFLVNRLSSRIGRVCFIFNSGKYL